MSLVSEIQTILDESGGAVYWSLPHIYDAANEALLDIWPRVAHEELATEISVVPGQPLVALPTDIMVPKYLIGQVGKYFPTTHARVEQYRQDWRTAGTGYPKHFILWDIEHLRPFPLPDTEYLFDVYGVPWPTEIDANNSSLDADPLLQCAVAHAAAGTLMSYSQPAFAKEATAESERLLHGYQVRLRNSQSHNIQRLRPGTVFSNAQSGSIRIGRRLS